MKLTWSCLLLVGCLCLVTEGFWFERERHHDRSRSRDRRRDRYDDVDDDDDGGDDNGGMFDRNMDKTAKSVMGTMFGLARNIDTSMRDDNGDGDFVDGFVNGMKRAVNDEALMKDVGNVVGGFMGMMGGNGLGGNGRGGNGGNNGGGFFFR